MISIPIAWIKILLLITQNKYFSIKNTAKQLPLLDIMTHLIIWSCFGIPYLLLMHFTNDSIVFFKSCFVHVNNKEVLTEISEIDYKFLKRVTKKFISEGISIIDSKTFNQAFVERYLEIEQKYKVMKVKKYSINSDFSHIIKFNQINNQNLMIKNIELELLEASNFISNFSNNFIINLNQMNHFFKNIKLLKKKRFDKPDKKFPHSMQIINVSKFEKIVREFNTNDN